MLALRMMQQVLSTETHTVRALQRSTHNPANSLRDRLDNLALVDAVLRENKEVWAGDVAGVEQGQAPLILDLLLAMYRLYCRRCATEVSPLSRTLPSLSSSLLLAPPRSFSLLLAPRSLLLAPPRSFLLLLAPPRSFVCVAHACELQTGAESAGAEREESARRR